MLRGNGVEGFRVLNPQLDVTQESSESRVILWSGEKRGGEGNDMMR